MIHHNNLNNYHNSHLPLSEAGNKYPDYRHPIHEKYHPQNKATIHHKNLNNGHWHSHHLLSEVDSKYPDYRHLIHEKYHPQNKATIHHKSLNNGHWNNVFLFWFVRFSCNFPQTTMAWFCEQSGTASSLDDHRIAPSHHSPAGKITPFHKQFHASTSSYPSPSSQRIHHGSPHRKTHHRCF